MIRESINSLFSALNAFFKGTERFANAYAEIGGYTEDAAKNFRKEEQIRADQRNNELLAQLGELPVPTETTKD
jgi:hypothetical protein